MWSHIPLDLRGHCFIQSVRQLVSSFLPCYVPRLVGCDSWLLTTHSCHPGLTCCVYSWALKPEGLSPTTSRLRLDHITSSPVSSFLLLRKNNVASSEGECKKPSTVSGIFQVWNVTIYPLNDMSEASQGLCKVIKSFNFLKKELFTFLEGLPWMHQNILREMTWIHHFW